MVDEEDPRYRPRRAILPESDQDSDFEDDFDFEPETIPGRRAVTATEPGPLPGDDGSANRPSGTGHGAWQASASAASAPDRDADADRVPITPTAPPPKSASAATTPTGGADSAPVRPNRPYRARHSAGASTDGDLDHVARHSASEPGVATPPREPSSTDPAGSHAPSTPPPAATLTVSRAGAPNRVIKRRRAVLAGGLAVGLILILGICAGVYAATRPTTTGAAPPPVTASASRPSASASTSAQGPVPDEQMLGPDTAKQITDNVTWRVASDHSGAATRSASATCQTMPPSPVAVTTRIRTLTATGTRAPAALHEADVYASVKDATAAMAARTKAFGDCATDNAWIIGGTTATGLGDQAVGLTVVIQGGKPVYHTVLLNRSGAMVNVVDVAAPNKAVPMAQAAAALARLTDRQCSAKPAGCATSYQLQYSMPPEGSTAPGFLITADIPQVDPTGRWTPGKPTTKPDVKGTRCETITFDSVQDASATHARTYILSGNGQTFGVDTVLITMRSDAAASDLAGTIDSDIAGCHDNMPTATVSAYETFTVADQAGTKFDGTTYQVTQQVDPKTSYRYRVGVVAVDKTVVYLFANPNDKADFTDGEWTALNVRAAQRSTQLP